MPKKGTTAAMFLVVLALVINNFSQQTNALSTPTEFTPADAFPIPNQNATITFGLNGTYTAATLQNDTWTFENLQLSYPQSALGFNLSDAQPIGDLKFSAKDCNVTIYAYLTFYYTLPVNSLMYYVNGSGTQTVNLGLNITRSDPSEWSIITGNNVFLAAQQGWKLLPDNTLVIEDTSGNVTIAHFQLDTFTGSAVFALQHLVAILTGGVFAAVVAAAFIIKLRATRHTKEVK
jgi:hypothetical protein